MHYIIQQLEALQANTPLFYGMRHGIERESLRVTAEGLPAQTPHPVSLGHKLTHPYITTDYSENLLELITPPCMKVNALLEGMRNTHQFVVEQLPNEWLWPQSLPCPLKGPILIADYGNSPKADLKTQYREGLALRYGRAMQTIAGVHYNFSLPQSFWELWYTTIDPAHDNLQSCIDAYYFHIIREHIRHVWILIYLFGASTAIDQTLLLDKKADYLEKFDETTWVAPYACSLRLTPLGYYSEVQNKFLNIRFDSLSEYIQNLKIGMTTSYPPYEALSAKHGETSQLNTHILQTEWEFYYHVRPKRVPEPGESTLDALQKRGVEYIEIRAVDVNPFEPTGFSRNQLLFLDIYLLFCLLQPSELLLSDERKIHLDTLHKVASQGRDPHLTLLIDEKKQSVTSALLSYFDQFLMIAKLLDHEESDGRYETALRYFYHAVKSPDLLLSSQYQHHLQQYGNMTAAGMALAKQHKKTLTSTPLPPEIEKQFREQVLRSLE